MTEIHKASNLLYSAISFLLCICNCSHNYIFVCCFVCLFVARLRLPPMSVARGTRRGSKLWMLQIQRSRPLNQSSGNPHHKSSRRPAHSPPAPTQHQTVWFSGIHTCAPCPSVCAGSQHVTELDM